MCICVRMYDMYCDAHHICQVAMFSVCFFVSKRKIPEEGWSDNRIEMLLHELAAMDSNNFPG